MLGPLSCASFLDGIEHRYMRRSVTSEACSWFRVPWYNPRDFLGIQGLFAFPELPIDGW